jgi:hypothetical protein
MRLYELKPGQKKEFHPSNTEEPQSFTTFLTNCSESIAAMREAKSFLYRGIKSTKGDIFLGRPRANRNAVDTKGSIQKEVDKFYTAAGFTALRSNSIFCCGDINTAISYGDPYIIFPINGFAFTWSPKIYDFYDYMQSKDINNPSDLYSNQDVLDTIRKSSDRIANKLDSIIIKRRFDDVGDELYYIKVWFNDISYEYNPKEIPKFLMKASKKCFDIEKKYKVDLKTIHAYISEINELLKTTILTSDQVLSNLQYTDKDFAAALKSKKEIIVNGEYYAFTNNKYHKYLWDALIK